MKRDEPLLVMDQKRGKHGFVIIDYDAYCALHQPPAQTPEKFSLKTLAAIPFRERGLLWDRSDLTDTAFLQRLRNAAHPEHAWAVTRLFERLPSHVLLRAVPWRQLVPLLKQARLRPALRKPWEHAIAYWRQTT
ncbi:MAG: hypothetical protein HY696_00550 [Deltaproteobacteria bacterium]|nr:hypothetical protein [Deltaproteobacteria bacterium]